MPYTWEKRHALLLPHVDARRKLTDSDRAKIIKLYDDGLSIRGIARAFEGKCSRRLIQFVIFPDRAEKVAFDFKIRRLDGRYYKRVKHTAYMRKHRQRKQKLIKGGK